ncbi:MAG: hypothetical protein K6G44_16265 [Lentisphaeria bacterium]|nr:hypothetical protein [Lentisphaeria bacterium]
MSYKYAAIGLAMLAVCSVAKPLVTEYHLDSSGVVTIGDGIQLDLRSYPKDWKGRSAMSVGHDTPDLQTLTAHWELQHEKKSYGNGFTALRQVDAKQTEVRMAVTMTQDLPTEGLVCHITIPEKLIVNGTFQDDKGNHGIVPKEYTVLSLYLGKPRRFMFILPGVKRRLGFELPEGTRFNLQDDRQWGPTFTMRIYLTGPDLLKAGKTYETTFKIVGEVHRAVAMQPFVIRQNNDWIPLDYYKDIQPNSAIDFSQLPFRDAPAGKHGWLKNDHGHFVFEKLPGKPQRFWGVNLCIDAPFLLHEGTDKLITRLCRAGYNSIRIHNCEAGFVKGSADRMSLNADMMERFDYLFAQAKKNGIYVTTDLYVSRKVLWQDIGLEGDGAVPDNTLKALFLFHDPAFENWRKFAEKLLGHVNPYTNLRYADDPAMPFIALINEGAFAWSRGEIFDLSVTQQAWKQWLAKKRAVQADYAKGVSDDCRGCTINTAPAYFDFMSDMEARFTTKAADFLHRFGVKAMLTDWNCGPMPRADAITQSLDYVDTHFYIDHPSFISESWALANVSRSRPDRAVRGIPLGVAKLAREAGKPFTISEWNFCRPNPYRNVGGLLTGYCAARLDWDALWRFYYLGFEEELDDGTPWLPYLNPNGYFHIVSDPFQVASDRAGLLLFMNRQAVKPNRLAQNLGRFPLAIEEDSGRFTIATSCTAGGFALDGDTLKAAPLTARVRGSQAAVWASSVDLKPLVESNRILLTFLTDLQKDGTQFLNEKGLVLQKWGTERIVVHHGEANVTLALRNAADYDVWMLETDGRRVAKVPVKSKDGKLSFTASVKGPDGKAHFLFEVVHKDMK